MKTETILIICHSNLLRMRNVSDKSSRENQNTYFMFSNFFFFENCAIYGIMLKNAVQSARPQTVWCTYIASWITKATNTWSEYVILNAFPLQQCLNVTLYIQCLPHLAIQS